MGLAAVCLLLLLFGWQLVRSLIVMDILFLAVYAVLLLITLICCLGFFMVRLAVNDCRIAVAGVLPHVFPDIEHGPAGGVDQRTPPPG